MESNQITCPQCGLENNYLTEACAQCGIIFVKNPAMQVLAIQDEQKRKAMAEEETPVAQGKPSAESDAAGEETIRRPASEEDTIEMEIPAEPKASETQTQSSTANAPKLKGNQKPEKQEISKEAMATPLSSEHDIMATMDAEELFLKEINVDPSAEFADPKPVEKRGSSLADPEVSFEQSIESVEPDTVMEENKDRRHIDMAAKEPDAAKMVEATQAQSRFQSAPKATALTGTAPAESEKSAEGVGYREHTQVSATDPAQPTEQEPSQQKSSNLFVTEKTPIQAEDEALVQTFKEQAEVQAIEEALEKQRKAQAKAEALRMEKAAKVKAADTKKQKLVRPKAEALKQQQAAQARAESLKKQKMARAKALALKKQRQIQTNAEALKNQKKAQSRAESSVQGMPVAGCGAQKVVLQMAEQNLNVHAKLLGLLKKYKGKTIGINSDHFSEISTAELVEANEEFFSVMLTDKKLQYTYPLKTIFTLIEGHDGVEAGEDGHKLKYNAIIKIYPLV